MAKFTVRSLDAVEKVRKRTILELFNAVIMDTPVGSPHTWNISPTAAAYATATGYVGGRLRANWQTTLGSPASGTVNSTNVSTATSSVAGSLGDGSQPVFLTNNLPYVEAIEFGAHSSKAPTGMVRKNVIRFGQIINKHTSAIR